MRPRYKTVVVLCALKAVRYLRSQTVSAQAGRARANIAWADDSAVSPVRYMLIRCIYDADLIAA